MSDNIAIKAQNISKTFHEQAGARSFKSAFVNAGNSLKGKGEKKINKGDFTALKDINFEIKKGEFFGIVGRNGSGKSTLLKILAGVYTPTTGAVTVNGNLTPFIELGVGFNPELSGRDNVYLNGALLGFNRKQMDEMYDDIVEFAELKDFMDTKLKNYSSGMQVRLAFSVAIRAESDILLIDEVLAVGDAAFQQKCYDYFAMLKKAKKTVVFVSHDLEAVKNFCTTGILINNSSIRTYGKINRVVEGYRSIISDNLESIETKSNVKKITNKKSTRKNAHITYLKTKYNNKIKKVFKPNQEISIEIEFIAKKELINPVVGVVVTNNLGLPIIATNTKQLNTKLGIVKNGSVKKVEFIIPNFLTDGRYGISCAVNKEEGGISYDRLEDSASFIVNGFDFKHSITHMPINIKVENA